MNDVFEKCLQIILKFEGGYSNVSADHGGTTYRGIIQREYDRYRKLKGLELQSVINMSSDEMREIYYENYWLASNADKMLAPLALVHFDTAVNSGIKQATLFLQRNIGVVADGIVGEKTLSAIAAITNDQIKNTVYNYIDQRSKFLIKLVLDDNSQIIFLDGWMTRVRKLERLALA